MIYPYHATHVLLHSQIVVITQLHVYYRYVGARVLKHVARSHSPMAAQIMSFLKGDFKGGFKEGTGRTMGGTGTMILVGHDTDLDALAELFGLSWSTPPFPPNATTPGSALRFDIDVETRVVEANVVFQPLNGSSKPTIKVSPAAFTMESSMEGGVYGKASPNMRDIADIATWLATRLDPACMLHPTPPSAPAPSPGHSPFIPGDGGNGEGMQPGILVAVVVAGIVLVVVVAVLAYGLYQRRRKAAEDEYTEFSSTA